MLSKKDLDVFNGIKEYIEREGISPSVRDICRIANVSSSSTAYRYIEKLKSAGLIDTRNGLSRSIRILKEPVQAGTDSVSVL